MALPTLPDHDEVLALYEAARFRDAYDLTRELWGRPEVFEHLDTRQAVLGARLASRLGGHRFANVMFGLIRRRDPLHPLVRYYAKTSGADGSLFATIRAFESSPELDTDDEDLRASWFASAAQLYALLLDFDAAHRCLHRAHDCVTARGWVASCHAEVLLHEDRPEEALAQAEEAWRRQPGMPFTAKALCRSLARLNRGEEAAARLREWVLGGGQSHEVLLALLAQLIRNLERRPQNERPESAAEVFELGQRFAQLAPLADRHAWKSLHVQLLDAARLAGDYARYAELARRVDIPFCNATARNLASNPGGKRVVLPHQPVRQAHNTCLPASVCTVLSGLGVTADQHEIARELTYDGTASWRMDDYARKAGLRVRHFVVDLPSVHALIGAGVPFVIAFDYLNNAHACAVVGVDFALGTLLIHDPSFDGLREQLLEHVGKGEAPLGPRGAVLCPPALADKLDKLPLGGEREADVFCEFQRVEDCDGAPALLAFLQNAALPDTPTARYLNARALSANGRAREALDLYQRLLQQWPDCVVLQRALIAATHAQGDTARMRSTLHSILSRKPLPGAAGGQEYIYPAPHLYARYANLLRASAASLAEARYALRTALRRGPMEAEAYFAQAELNWQLGRHEEAALPFRLASTLHAENDHYARCYADTLHRLGRDHEAIQWLERRAKRFVEKLDAPGPIRTLVDTLEDYGFPEQALARLREGLKARPTDGELASFAAMTFARYALREEATAALAAAACHAPPASYHHAAGNIARIEGKLPEALGHALKRMEFNPTSIPARSWLLHLTGQQQGPPQALKLAEQWVAEHPGDEAYEELLLDRLDRTTDRDRRLQILRARLARNDQDAWAWRELGFTLLAGAETASATRRLDAARELENAILRCEYTSPESHFTILMRAEWLVLHSRHEQAFEGFAHALQVEPTYEYAFTRMFDMARVLSGPFPRRAADKADAALSRHPGQWTQAPRIADQLARLVGIDETRRRVARWVRRERRDPWPVLAWADLLLDHGQGVRDARRVVRRLQRTIARFPLHVQVRYSLAQAWATLQRPEDEMQALRGILATAPHETRARVLYAECLHLQGRVAEAAQELTKATEIDPLEYRAWNALVSLHEEQRNLPAALEAARAGCEHAPDAMNLWERRVRMLEGCGRGEEALAVARDVAGRFPAGAYAQLLLARAMRLTLSQARRAEIEAQYEKAISLNAQMFDAVDEYAEFLCLHARFEDARRLVERHLRVAESASPLKARLAEILRAERRNEDALQAAAALVRERPEYAYGWLLLFDWAVEDKKARLARELLPLVPPVLEQNASFCSRRLEFLEQADAPREETEQGWVQLVENFPQHEGINLRRMDNLMQANRLTEAEQHVLAFLRHRPVFAPALSVLVRVYCSTRRPEEAMNVADKLWFDSTDTEVHDCRAALDALETASRAKVNLMRVAGQVAAGRLPRLAALRALAIFAARQKHGHELTALAKALEPRVLEYGSWEPFATVLDCLTDADNAAWVLGFRDHHRQLCHDDVQLWMVVGRALCNARRHEEAVRWLSQWRKRAGLQMWGMSNYVWALLFLGRYSTAERESIAVLGELEHDHAVGDVLETLILAGLHECDVPRAMGNLHRHREILKRIENKSNNLLLVEMFDQLAAQPDSKALLALDKRFRTLLGSSDTLAPWLLLKCWRQAVKARLPWLRRLRYSIVR